MGFIHDVTRILDKLKSRRNLGMFSATISREVMDISWMYQRDPEEITVQAKEENKPDIAQYRIDVDQNDKAHVMAQIIRAEGHERVKARGRQGALPPRRAAGLCCDRCGRARHRRGRCGRGIQL